MKEVNTDRFKEYAAQIISNCRALGDALSAKGEKFITGGTDNHLLMWDLRPHEITGSKLEKVFDKMYITTNKNAMVGDKS